MTLGEWLNRMILDEDGPEDAVSQAYFEDRPAAAEPASRWSTDFAEPRGAALQGDEIHRVAAALERLTERIEISEGRTGQALSGVEGSVRDAIARIEAAEREQIAVAARFEGAVGEARSDQDRMAERLRRLELEASGPRSSEALRALEQAVGRIAAQVHDAEARSDDAASVADLVVRMGSRLDETESRTAETLEGLRRSFATLDARLSSVEGGLSETLEPRLEQLASSLAARVDAVRSEIAEQLQASAEGRFDEVNARLETMAAHLGRAEQNSTRAIERMGREVLTLAESLSRRVQSAEARSAQAIEQVGGEMARIGQAMNERLGRAETVQAQALERLGGEIGKISDRLAERMAAAERRSAQAIDEVGEQVARVTERLGERGDRISDEIAERIRQSEERTARLLDEARETIAEAQRRQEMLAAAAVAEPPAPQDPEPTPEPERAPTAVFSPFGAEPEPAQPAAEAPDDPFPPFAAAAPEADPLAQRSLAEALHEPFVVEPFDDEDDLPPQFDAADFEAADGFAPIEDPEHGLLDLDMPVYEEPAASPDPAPPKPWRFEPAFAPVTAEVESRARTTRELVEQARAAAAGAAPELEVGKRAWSRKARVEGGGPASFFAGLAGRPKSRPGSTVQTALVVATCAASLGVAAGGMALLGQHEAPESLEGAPRAAVALSPQPLESAAAASPAVEFEAAVAAMQAGDPAGLEALRRVAANGHAPAQFFLAKLYERGEGGVAVDLMEARLWAERAAAYGNRGAMHMLAEAYLRGAGGEKDAVEAALWFRRAADLGWVRSQFALGALHEQGLGVSADLGQAYKWYLVASRSGDDEARRNALRVRPLLSAEARLTAERAAGGFRSAPPQRAAVEPAGDAPRVRAAQEALAKLGYYQGPADGAGAEALRPAVAAYQRRSGLPVTGALDAPTVAQLAVYTR